MSLVIGSKAPSFSGTLENGQKISLNDYAGRKLIIYFYPQDFTPDCTAQSCNLAQNYTALAGKGYEVLGISSDSVESHKAFKEKHKLPYHLIADTDHSIQKLYGVEPGGGLLATTKRHTFIINGAGVIEQIITDVDTRHHSTQILSGTDYTPRSFFQKITDKVLNRIVK